MSERYSKLFALPENLYASGSPVVIAAGALLKDNQTGKVIAQLKMRNIGTNIIKATKVCVRPLDTVGNPLGEEIEYQYLDLNVNRNDEFGSKVPIPLTDATTRSYTASISEVVFADNTVWSGTDEPWEALSAPTTLDGALTDRELIKQYRINFGTDCKYNPTVQKDLWYCACGELNRKEETSCHHCKKSASSLLSVDLEALKKERDARVAAEQRKAAEEKAAEEVRAKRTKKMAMIIAPIVVLLIIAAVLISNIVKKNQEEAARIHAEESLRDTYNTAVALMEKGEYEEAIAAFKALDGYKDSVGKIEACEEEAARIQAEKALLDTYNTAVVLMEKGEYEEAIAAFKALDGYKDSVGKIEACETAILDGDYNTALALIDAGKYNEAYAILIALDGYKDSDEKANSIYNSLINLAKVGDYIFFGSYEQDNNFSNGKETIEWLVLEVNDGKALLVSRYALDCRPYNSVDTDVTWETCTLRTWLNNSFLIDAFSDYEIAMIPTVTVSPDENQYYSTSPGIATKDQVFLLSIPEATNYFASNDAIWCKPTDYAVANGAWEDNSGICWWWLRSPGKSQRVAGCGNNSLGVNQMGVDVTSSYIAVRPAVWINIDP